MAGDDKATWKTALYVALVAVGFIGGVIGLTQLTISADDPGVQWHASLPLLPGETLRVETVNGVITYETWDGSEVEIEATARARALTNGQARRYTEQVQVDLIRTEGGVEAVARLPQNLANLNTVTVNFRVRVPEDWRGRVELRTINGQVMAANLHGDAEVETATGPISIRSHSGSLKVITGNGAINVTDANTVLDAFTSNGTIDVSGAVLRGQGFARTLNGTVRIHASLDEEATLQVDTSQGSVSFVLTDPDVALDLAANNGTVRLHADVAASLRQPDKLVGSIGAGRAVLHARANNGSIDLYVTETTALQPAGASSPN